jgi:ligand-binding SRPBCC domain-containing protein
MHTLLKITEVPLRREEVFAFFSDAGNLERITPPELNFNIITPQPLEIKKDSLIEYQLRLFGVKLSWLTIISEWNPPEMFVDEQLKGPYRKWHHTHRFHDKGERTIIEDEVNYELPFYPFGEAVHPLIKFQLKRIFNYREKIIKDLLK